jgi:hypothetical protein
MDVSVFGQGAVIGSYESSSEGLVCIKEGIS